MVAETTPATGQPADETQPAVCSFSSRRADEQLFGTVTQTRAWLLLEDPNPPGAKALEDSRLPQAVKEHLAGLVKQLPAARLLLIRRRAGSTAGGPRLFVARAAESEPALYEFHLPDYDALPALDLRGLALGERDAPEQRRSEPLFLVCTNGRRDPCCARWGQPVFETLAAAMGEAAWQCSHIGGHRFAGNLVCFPHGIVFGRVSPESVERVVSAYRSGRLDLAHYRGRGCYRPEAQAGEYFLRSHTGADQVEAYRLAGSQETAAGAFELRFDAPAVGKAYRLALARETAGYQVIESCGGQPAARQMFRLEGLAADE